MLYSDPGCPWAYCANPALTVLRWRYGNQLRWRLVTIGLSEDTRRHRARGYTPERQAARYQTFRQRFGMPFTGRPRPRLVSTGRACRAIVAARLAHPGREFAVLRALQFGWFCHFSVLGDTDSGIFEAIRDVGGIDPRQVVRMIDSEEVERAYQTDRSETRSAEGGPADLQGKTANSDGPVRFTAPSVVFELDGKRLQAGGFQSLDAYDVCVANLDPTLERKPAPDDPLLALSFFGEGLTTAEVAQLMTKELDDPDHLEAEKALAGLVGAGVVRRLPLGQDELWTAVDGG
jgi:protein-disulfide isomerase-like protein with CxxC motif